MAERAKTAVRKLLALVVLAVAAWILLKLVIGVVAFVAWIVAGIIAVLAILWALNELL